MSCASKFWTWNKGDGGIELNNIEKRAIVLQLNANNPIEDRHSAIELQNFEGYFISVLDGHGGHQLAEFANERLFKYFDNYYKSFKDSNSNNKLKEDEIVTNALLKTFENVERDYYEIAKDLYKNGEGRMATVGSCVTVALITPHKIYASQLGDSKAKLFRSNKDGNYNVVKLTNTHNAEKKSEQIILRSEFTDKDIVVCKRPNNKVCYVKGRLQPTRSLGDFHLKYREFNQMDGSNYKKPISTWNGPYIKSIPEIKIVDIQKDDEYLVMATDGLWDYLNSKEVGTIIKNNKKSGLKGISNALFEKLMQKAAEENNLTVEKIMSTPPGSYKRRIHDDITLIVFDLKH